MQKITHPQNEKLSSSSRMVTPTVCHTNGAEIKNKKSYVRSNVLIALGKW